MSALSTITLFELKGLLRTPIYWIGWLLTIGWALIWDSPLRHGELWTDRHCAYRFGHGVVTLGLFILAIIFANSLRIDRVTKSPAVLFTQPIKSTQYALGKFLGIFLGTFVPIVAGLIFYLFIPLFFGQAPYSPKMFIEVLLLYIVPSLLFYSSLCYLVVILLKEFLFATIIPIVYFLNSEVMLPWLFHIRIPSHLLTPLTYGMSDVATTSAIYSDLLINRGILCLLALALLTTAVMSYSHKKYL